MQKSRLTAEHTMERKIKMDKIIIIDDDKELRLLMKKCMEQETYTAAVAGGGAEGLRLIEENKDTCSLVILDIMMPDLDGFQVLLQIFIVVGSILHYTITEIKIVQVFSISPADQIIL